ncbi:MAG: general secretion pathway protein GspK [Deltaproteobacteria bacterium]|nr:general secretion pathway protein GspK [Candidatus Anaeroferrophillus wilburensis]MBN2888365.1 general secretion pathway protein GspK [Deltaproteobacteria bacterium]
MKKGLRLRLLMRLSGKRGFALLAVFWLTLLLTLVCLGYATESRFRGQAALNRKRQQVVSYGYRSAAEKGFHEYLKARANRVLLDKRKEIEGIAEEAVDLWFPRFEAYDYQLDDQQFMVRLVSEGGKFAVNEIPVSLWQEILAACGIPVGAAQTGIVNAVLDWIDADDNHRIDGAENDYYQGLDTAYQCKNHPLESLTELLLVKGVTPELYHGSEERPGLKSFLSVYGERSRIDVNSAAPAAFQLVDGISDEIIEEIVQRRQEQPFQKIQDLAEVVPQAYYAQLSRLFTVVSSPRYVTVAVARKGADGSPGGWHSWTIKP